MPRIFRLVRFSVIATEIPRVFSIANPNANILYSPLAKGPKALPRDQLTLHGCFSRTKPLRHHQRDRCRWRIQNYPDDYGVVNELHRNGELSIPSHTPLYAEAEQELADFQTWTKMTKPATADDFYRVNGAGEMLVFSAADFEDILVPRPDMLPFRESELKAVIGIS